MADEVRTAGQAAEGIGTSSGQGARFRPAESAGLFVRGFAMGVADVIPGVSGGTIAFITGIYERFVAALGSLSLRPLAELLRGRPRAAAAAAMRMHWATLLPVLGGIAVAIITMSRLVIGLMETYPGTTYAFFFGLILASAGIPFARMRRVSWTHLGALGLLLAAAWVLVGLQATGAQLAVGRRDAGATAAVYPGTLRSAGDLETALGVVAGLEESRAEGFRLVVMDRKGVLAGADVPGNVVALASRDQLRAWLAEHAGSGAGGGGLIVLEEKRASPVVIFGAGAVAISAMILPGISGSFLLLFMGQYHAVFSTLHRCIGHVVGLVSSGRDPVAALSAGAWWSDFLFLGMFGAGVLVGMALFSRVITWLFRCAHDVTMAALTGLMLGALRQPGREVLAQAENVGHGGGYWAAVLGAVLAGVAIVAVLWVFDRKREAAEPVPA